MISKRGQAGAAAAAVAVMALLLVLYVLFLPTDVRNELINGTTTSTSSSSSATSVNGEKLVFEHPGTLDPVNTEDRQKALDSFNLYAETNAVVLGSAESIHVENGWFTKKSYNLTFSVSDVQNTDNYVVAFDVAQSQGQLTILFNGDEIYNGNVPVGNAEPIKVSKDLVKKENSLVFEVSGVGLAFWRLNQYDIKNPRIVADFTDVSKRAYENFFVLSATEQQNLDTTKLTFVPDCLTPSKVGPLSISINGHPLHYSAVADCGSLSQIEFDPAYLKQGENTIDFSTTEGNYFIDRVSVTLKLKEAVYPIYYFELSSNDVDRIQNKTANVTLQLKFTDKEDKEGELIVNGHSRSILTSNATYDEIISDAVESGQNYLQIKPVTVLNIVDLSVIFRK